MTSAFGTASRPFAFLGAAVAAALLSTGAPSLAQAKGPRLPVNVVIYRGDSLASSGITVGAWGSGTVEKDGSKIFSGTESLRVTTHGMYQGASLRLAKPVNLGSYIGNKNDYLTIAIYPPSANGANAPQEGSFPGYGGGKLGGFGAPGSPGGPGLGGNPGSPGGAGGYGGYGGYGKNGGAQVQTQKNRKLENLRLVLVTTTGKNFETLLPLANAVEDNQWKVLAVPISVIPGLTSEDGQISEMRFFGDAPSSINIGSIGITEDATPITINTINDKTVQRLARYQYLASADAGVTPLVYSWDWDASDGIQDETEGRNVTHTFRKASVDEAGKSTDFVVTVTVSDLYHIKPPAKTSFHVHVTP